MPNVMGGQLCWKYIWPLTITGMFSSKPSNSFLRKNSYVFPVKLLSKTNGPINLLPSKPHHTFIDYLLLKVVTLVWCGFPWNHVHKFHVFIPSWVKNTSFVNKMTLNNWGCAVIQKHRFLCWVRSPGLRCWIL